MIVRFVLCLAVVFAVGMKVTAKSDLPPGNYIVYYAPSAANEQGLFLIKIEHRGGKDRAEVLDPKEGAEVESIHVEDRQVVIVFKAFGRTLSFDGAVDTKDNKVIVGSFGDDALITRSRLMPTEADMIDPADRVKISQLPEPMIKAQQLTNKVMSLRFKIREVRDEETRAELKKEIEAAQKEADEQAPALYKEVLAKHADSPAVVDAFLALIPTAQKNAKPEEVARWLKSVDTFGAKYGSRYRLEVLGRSLGSLSNQTGFEAVTLDAAEQAARGIAEGTTIGQQVKVLTALRTAQEKGGKPDLAKQTVARLAKLDEQLDQEYLAKVPPFKPTRFQGRKEKSDKVAVMELFTGAQCPPCVAADAAFDGLLKAYKPTELLLIQYHMHIPGPDPLTNPDTIDRWEYYRKKFDRSLSLGGVPMTLFNGKPGAGGGGGMSNAENKFKQYREIIDPLLEETTSIKMSGIVNAKAEQLSIKVDVDGVNQPGGNVKLRLLLVEESIRYVGGNGIRFHHHVVRAMPGGVNGVALTESKGATTAEVDLVSLRKKLAKYLDDFVATEGPFSNPDRPLALKNLRVIAIVQDDASGQILQGLQLDVK